MLDIKFVREIRKKYNRRWPAAGWLLVWTSFWHWTSSAGNC
ncbi:hypothetical protein [Thermosinus carboxydivorans]|nr:hypothetical protein [Thermosinus carboxydivorans]